jgi:hypothetical protein
MGVYFLKSYLLFFHFQSFFACCLGFIGYFSAALCINKKHPFVYQTEKHTSGNHKYSVLNLQSNSRGVCRVGNGTNLEPLELCHTLTRNIIARMYKKTGH